MFNNETNEVIEGNFKSLKKRYQNNFKSIKFSDFAFNYVHWFYYKCQNINPNRGGLYIDYIDSPGWEKTKK